MKVNYQMAILYLSNDGFFLVIMLCSNNYRSLANRHKFHYYYHNSEIYLRVQNLALRLCCYIDTHYY